MAVESQFLFVYNKMKSQVLALWLLVSTTIADDLIEEQVKEAEVVKEDKGGVDKRAERLMDRLEALKEVEQALQVVDKESSGADFVQVKNTSIGNKNTSAAAELLARLKTIKEQSRSFNPDENFVSISRKQSGKGQSNGLLARLSAIKEQRRGSSAQETSVDDVGSILSMTGHGQGKKVEGRERLKELSATLDSLLLGRLNKEKSSPRKNHSDIMKSNLGLKHGGRSELSSLEGLELGSLTEKLGQGGNVFLFLLSGSEKPVFTING